MTIKKNITPENRWQGRFGDAVEWIVLHYTGNPGDTAKGEAAYFASQYVGASAHFFVDTKEVWQSVELEDTAWHCGDAESRNGCHNTNSVGVEMCCTLRDGEYFIEDATVARTVELVKWLLTLYPGAKLCRHFDVTGKICPEPWVRAPVRWDVFCERVKEESMTREERKEFESLAARVGTLEQKARAGEEFDRIIKRTLDAVDARTAVRWRRAEDAPPWLRPTAEKLVSRGFLLGDGRGDLALTEGMARVLVALDRAGGFDGTGR